MSKVKIIVRKVSSPYSEKNGWAAEFLEKNGRRFFVAEQFGKELTTIEEELARPRDLVHLVGFSWKFGKDNGHALCGIIKNFGQACYEEARAIDVVREELAAVRKERNLAAQAVADIALPIHQRKIEHAVTDEEVKARYAAAAAKYDNRLKWATPRMDSFRKAVNRLAAVLECTAEDRANLCGHFGR